MRQGCRPRFAFAVESSGGGGDCSAGGGAASDAPGTGQLGQLGAQAPQHPGEGAGIGIVEHQQVRQGQQVLVPLVAGAEGDGAVEQLQQMGDAGGAGQGAGGEKDLQALAQTDETFQEAAQDQEPPAQVACRWMTIRTGCWPCSSPSPPPGGPAIRWRC